MPEGNCARCDEKEPAFWFIFANSEGQEKLGFCSNECFDRFVQAMDAARELQLS